MLSTECEQEIESKVNFIIITLRVTNYLDVRYSERLVVIITWKHFNNHNDDFIFCFVFMDDSALVIKMYAFYNRQAGFYNANQYVLAKTTETI